MEKHIKSKGRFKSNKTIKRTDKMKRELMEIICCPTCKGDLILSVEKEDEKEIIKGVLKCGKCGVDYLIEDGIPNLLPKNLK